MVIECFLLYEIEKISQKAGGFVSSGVKQMKVYGLRSGIKNGVRYKENKRSGVEIKSWAIYENLR